MQFGLMTEPQLGMTYETQLNLARWAEQAGLAAFARADHYSFRDTEGAHATDAFAALAGLARETKTIDLVVLVSPITFRHPGVIVKMAATLDEMSNGRFHLGIGTGWMEKEHNDYGFDFFDQGERFDRFEEALEYAHHAFGRRSGPYRGDFYSLEETQVRPLPTNMRIIVGGGGPRRTPRLAGTWADEFNLFPKQPDELSSRIQVAREAALAAERDPDDIMFSVMVPVVAGRDQSTFEEVLDRVAAADPFGRTAEDLRSSYRDRGFPFGTAAEARDTLDKWASIGVDRVYIQHFGPPETDLLDEIMAAVQ